MPKYSLQDLDDAVSAAKAVPQRCALGKFVDSVEDEQMRERLSFYLSDYDTSSPTMKKVLREMFDVDFDRSTFHRHRRGECACGKAQSK